MKQYGGLKSKLQHWIIRAILVFLEFPQADRWGFLKSSWVFFGGSKRRTLLTREVDHRHTAHRSELPLLILENSLPL